MEHKTWLWRKKTSEKTIAASDKVNRSSREDAEEKRVDDHTLELEKSVNNLNEKLQLALSECNAKNDLATKNAKMAEEALAGWEKAEAEALSLKQELDEAFQKIADKEERIAHLDAALKECMQQLRFVRDEQEHRIHDAVTKTAKEGEKLRMVIEEKLTETSKRLAKLNSDNNNLNKVLQVKEKMVEDLSKRNSQAEADYSALMARLATTEKANTSLQYELCILEKELEIRHEEKEFNRRLADAAQKHHLESVKKISKLEAECQKLRLLVQKRLPGPAALAKMKTEVEMLGRESHEMRRRSSPPLGGSKVKNPSPDRFIDSPSKRTNYLIEKLCAMEEENKLLKETLSKKIDELQSPRMVDTHNTSNLSNVELQLSDISKSKSPEIPKSSPVARELAFGSMLEDNRNEDAESWDSARISELEHSKIEKLRGSPCKSVAISDISLMDDFVEMEKLAIVSMDKSFDSSHVSDGSHASPGYLDEQGLHPSEGTGRELVPAGFTDKNHEPLAQDASARKYPGWLEDILGIIIEQHNVTQRSFDDIHRDITSAVEYMNNPAFGEVADEKKNSNISSGSPQMNSHVSCRPPNASPLVESLDNLSGTNILLKEECTEQLQSSLSKSVSKLLELIEGIINQASPAEKSSQHMFSKNDGSLMPHDTIEGPTGYMVRVFQWKSSELSDVLRQFSQTCIAVLNGKADVEQFAGQLTSAFDWIMNHCFSLQDVSSMRDNIKKHFDWDESQSENENGVGVHSSFSNDRSLRQAEEMQSSLRAENKVLKDELAEKETETKDLEGRLQSATDKLESLMVQLDESENSIASLREELETLKESKGRIEDQIENYKLVGEDLNTQLTVTKVELNEARQKFSSLEEELEDRSNCCQELEATCLELQLQLESVVKKEPLQYDADQEERQHQTDWKITAASAKLAECQETILNLGKQLKALAPARESAILDKVISTTPDTTTAALDSKNMIRHTSLQDQILADEDTEVEDLNSPKMKEIICTTDSRKPPVDPSTQNLNSSSLVPNGSSNTINRSLSNRSQFRTGSNGEMALAIVPSKKHGSRGGFLKKLLSIRKRGTNKMTLPMVA